MSSIGFGTWAWGNKFLWGYSPEKQDLILEETFKEAIKSGLNFIDTADSYGTGKLAGRSELLLGKFIKELPKAKMQNLIIATKLAPYPWRIGRNGFLKALNDSSNRLQGKIDRVQLHWSTYNYAPWQELQLIDGLGDLVKNGVIPELGVSNMGAKRLRTIHNRLKNRDVTLKSLQIQFSLLSPESNSFYEIKNVCEELNIEIISYSPLALGVLTIPPGTIKKANTFIRQQIYLRLLDSSEELRQGLQKIAAYRNVSQAQVALNWCRAHGTKPIVGIRTPKQAKEAAAATKWNLNKKEVQELTSLKNECNRRMPKNPFQSI
ncbi:MULTISPECIES: aldo/keto reductase [Prochlorococcus]|uniref:aldo/keto reductase n=1 Tax=Prochlorococcus TaxID=1218 RepID=UPI0005338D46|nr:MULTISPECIES: aldo/keto reductase [Prochlorococcus]KGG12175.1 Aldo/keto reductase family [Prochlorococcus sp. MIT 0601]